MPVPPMPSSPPNPVPPSPSLSSRPVPPSPSSPLRPVPPSPSGPEASNFSTSANWQGLPAALAHPGMAQSASARAMCAKLVIVVVIGPQLEDTEMEALAVAGRTLPIALLQAATALVQLLQQGQSLFTPKGLEFGH